MARKVKCPECGAKNPEGSLRCRICTAFVVPGGAAAAAELQREREAAEHERAAAADAAVEFDASVGVATAAAGPDPVPTAEAQPAVGIELEDLDLDSIAVFDEGIMIGATPPPPLPTTEGAEQFDPGALVIEFDDDRTSEPGEDDVSGPGATFERFDPDALVIVEPDVVVRPSDAGPDETPDDTWPPAPIGDPRH